MYLKKVKLGNPLQNFGLIDELKIYNSLQTDEELASFYHYLLDLAEKRKSGLFERLIYAMISYSTSKNINPQRLIS